MSTLECQIGVELRLHFSLFDSFLKGEYGTGSILDRQRNVLAMCSSSVTFTVKACCNAKIVLNNIAFGCFNYTFIYFYSEQAGARQLLEKAIEWIGNYISLVESPPILSFNNFGIHFVLLSPAVN